MDQNAGDVEQENADKLDQTVQRAPLHSYYALFILTVVLALNFVDRQILTILMEPIKHDLQVSDTAMGLLTGLAFAAFYAIAGFPVARWSDHANRRNVLSLCVAFWSAMTVASGMILSYWQLALARIGVAVGEAGAAPTSQSIIADLFPQHQRGKAMAVLTFGSGIGILLGLLLGGYLNTWFDWRTAFIVVGLPGFLVALIVRFTIKEPQRGAFDRNPPTASGETIWQVFGYLWSLRTFRYTMLGLAFHSFSGYAWTTWAPTFMIRVHDLNTAQVGLRIGVAVGIGVIIGNYLGGMIVDRFGIKDERWYVWVPGVGNFVAIPCAFLFVFLGDPNWAAASFIPLLITLSTWGAPTFAMGQTLAKPHMRAVTATIIGIFSSFVGVGLGPLYIGILNDLFLPTLGDEGIRYSLLATTPGLFLSGIFFFIAGRYAIKDFARARNEQ